MTEKTTPTTEAEIIRDLAFAASKTAIIEKAGSYFGIVPVGAKLESLDKQIEAAQAAPNRKRGKILMHDLSSFCAYTKRHEEPGRTCVYADAKNLTIQAVLNDNGGQDASFTGWRDHTCSLSIIRTKEYQLWLDNNGCPFDQTGFAEFIEANFADIALDAATNVSAQTMLTVATTISASTGIAFKSARRLQDGQTQITYNEDINASAGADGQLTIPKEFKLGLQIFQGDTRAYAIKARLKYRLNVGKINFWYELDRPERVEEDAFIGPDGYIDQIKSGTGVPVFMGAA